MFFLQFFIVNIRLMMFVNLQIMLCLYLVLGVMEQVRACPVFFVFWFCERVGSS